MRVCLLALCFGCWVVSLSTAVEMYGLDSVMAKPVAVLSGIAVTIGFAAMAKVIYRGDYD